MKVKSILSAILIFCCLTSVAQDKKDRDDDFEKENFFRFGAKAGVNVNKISGQSYKQGFNYNYQLGTFFQFNFSKRFGLQPEFNLVQSSYEFTNDANDIYNDIFLGGSQKKASLNYLEVPLLLNINVGESKHVKLQFGPAYGSVLKQTVDSLKSGGSIYKNAEFSAIGGLWIQLPFVNLGGRYKIGLNDVNGIDNRQAWRSQAIQVFVGVTF